MTAANSRGKWLAVVGMGTAVSPAGTSATNFAACVVDPALVPMTLAITNTASVAAPAGLVDLVPGDDTAAETGLANAPEILFSRA